MASTEETSRKTTTTTYETRTTYDGGDPAGGPGLTYRASVSPRSIVINRTSSSLGPGSAQGGRSSSSRNMTIDRHYGPPAGAYALVTSTGVGSVKQSREQEKKDMQDLNERFASYIEKVRFLEAQNRKLADELEKLKGRWGKETSQIKAMYQAELDEARRLLDEGDKEKARLEIRVASLEEQLQESRQNLDVASKLAGDSRALLDKQNQQIAELESELGLLRKRLDSAESDRDRDKKQIAQLQDALNRARQDLDNETLAHIDAENRRQTLEEEMEFLKSVHEQELKELSALAYRDTTAENREFWKNEMGQALREIQQIYDDKLDSMKAEMETYYNLKLQEFRTGVTRQTMEVEHAKEETKRLRTQLTDLRDKLADLDARNNQLQRELDNLRREKEERERELENENGELKGEVAKLRAELEAILKELQDIMDTKLGLELEIAAYRKLLEGEETRVGLKQLIDQWSTSGGSDAPSDDGSLRQSAKTTFQRSAKGPLAIAECSPDGKFIILENTGRKDEPVGGWSLKRNIDGADKAQYTFDDDAVIRPGSKVKVWASGAKPSSAPRTDIESDQPTWGVGSNVTTKLVNNNGEERATHVQKTLLS